MRMIRGRPEKGRRLARMEPEAKLEASRLALVGFMVTARQQAQL